MTDAKQSVAVVLEALNGHRLRSRGLFSRLRFWPRRSDRDWINQATYPPDVGRPILVTDGKRVFVAVRTDVPGSTYITANDDSASEGISHWLPLPIFTPRRGWLG